MRVTGAGDPTVPVADTLQGKLPQRKIVTSAAHGYSSYGNQIGLATGQVAEIYDEGYVAKRMEIGAVIAAAKKENVIRECPDAGERLSVSGRLNHSILLMTALTMFRSTNITATTTAIL